MFQFTHKKDIGAARAQVGGKVSLLGNIPPMALAENTPDEVYAMARECAESYNRTHGSTKGLLLSAGGGVPMGANRECIDALVRAAEAVNL
jgi:uroporphyrinogen-III decarboxylase